MRRIIKGTPKIGERYGRLVVVDLDAGRNARGVVLVSAVCDCGKYWTGVAAKLRIQHGATQSCGCLGRERRRESIATHELSKSKEYRIWVTMRRRCSNSGSVNYKIYGGRGIKVCPRWERSFENFYTDMGPRPSSRHTLDRKDNDGDYTPGNCRWATRSEQARNTQRTRWVEVQGQRMSLAGACESLDLYYPTVASRLRRGWPMSEALLPTNSSFQPL